MPDDRTVHAVLHDDWYVVRYDRAGKWYLEGYGSRMGKRMQVTLADAVRFAKDDGAEVRLGMPGGKLFDARYRLVNE
jgi:hypothetical protein